MIVDVLSPGLPTQSLSCAVLALIGIALCTLLATRTRVPGARQVTLACLFAHFAVTLMTYAAVGLFANDAINYSARSVSLARRLGGDDSATVFISNGKEGWTYVLGYLFHWLGYQPTLGLLLNAVLAAAIVPIVGFSCVTLGWSFAAKKAMWIAGFAPPLFIWSTFLLREPSINLSVAIAFAGMAAFLASRRFQWLLLPILACLLLVWLRGSVSVIIAVGLVLGVVLVGRIGTGKVHLGQALLAGGLAIIAVPIALRFLGSFASLASINQSRASLARSASTSFGDVASSTTFSGSVVVSIRQLPSASLGPFPWQWTGGLGGLLTAVDSITCIIFAYFIYRALRLSVARRGRWLALPPSALLLLALALTSGNFGTLVRIRGMVLPMLASLIAVGMSRRQIATQAVSPSPRAPESTITQLSETNG